MAECSVCKKVVPDDEIILLRKKRLCSSCNFSVALWDVRNARFYYSLLSFLVVAFIVETFFSFKVILSDLPDIGAKNGVLSLYLNIAVLIVFSVLGMLMALFQILMTRSLWIEQTKPYYLAIGLLIPPLMLILSIRQILEKRKYIHGSDIPERIPLRVENGFRMIEGSETHAFPIPSPITWFFVICAGILSFVTEIALVIRCLFS